jgi:hypothetical protein
MAREERDGSRVEMEVMAISPVFFSEVFLGGTKGRTDASRFSLSMGIHSRANVATLYGKTIAPQNKGQLNRSCSQINLRKGIGKKFEVTIEGAGMFR